MKRYNEDEQSTEQNKKSKLELSPTQNPTPILTLNEQDKETPSPATKSSYITINSNLTDEINSPKINKREHVEDKESDLGEKLVNLSSSLNTCETVEVFNEILNNINEILKKIKSESNNMTAEPLGEGLNDSNETGQDPELVDLDTPTNRFFNNIISSTMEFLNTITLVVKNIIENSPKHNLNSLNDIEEFLNKSPLQSTVSNKQEPKNVLNYQDTDGNTCLHYLVSLFSNAFFKNTPDCLEEIKSLIPTLVDMGADSSIVNKNNEAVLFITAMNKDISQEIFQSLWRGVDCTLPLIPEQDRNISTISYDSLNPGAKGDQNEIAKALPPGEKPNSQTHNRKNSWPNNDTSIGESKMILLAPKINQTPVKKPEPQIDYYPNTHEQYEESSSHAKN